MPLVLSLKKGQDFYVGEHCFIVDDVMSDTRFRLRHMQTGDLYAIDDKRAIEIMGNVFVSAGEKPMAMLAKVTIEAPRNVLILRGNRKRRAESME